MAEVLKGNFTPSKPVVVNEVKDAPSARFEREALRRLGGSIAFVEKKKFLYGLYKRSVSLPSSVGMRKGDLEKCIAVLLKQSIAK